MNRGNVFHMTLRSQGDPVVTFDERLMQDDYPETGIANLFEDGEARLEVDPLAEAEIEEHNQVFNPDEIPNLNMEDMQRELQRLARKLQAEDTNWLKP